MPLFGELMTLSAKLKADNRLTVVVIKSGNPDFFLAHFDVEAILQWPVGYEPQRDVQLSAFHAMCERFRTMNKVVIAQIEGRVGGGGSELAAACDALVPDNEVLRSLPAPSRGRSRRDRTPRRGRDHLDGSVADGRARTRAP